MKSGFKATINLNKYQSKVLIQVQNQYLGHMIDPSYQGTNKLSVLLSGDNAIRTRHIGSFLSKIEIKVFNDIIDGRNFFDQQVKNGITTNNNIREFAAG